MQQLQMPDLEGLDLDQLDRAGLDLDRAKQGDPKAINAVLNQKLHAKGITARSGCRDDRFGVLIEAETLPDRVAMTDWLRQEFEMLRPEGIDRVEVYGRQKGQRLPGWRETIELKVEPPADVDIFRLSDWLSQGESAGEIATPPSTSSEAAHRAQPVPPEKQASALSANFLRFYFNPEETALLPLESIKEVLRVPIAAILPVPHMPNSVLGIYNCRGNILWLVDLAVHLGLGNAQSLQTKLPTPFKSWQTAATSHFLAPASQTLHAIVLEVDRKTLGIVVPEVLDIEAHDRSQLQPPTATLFSPKLLPFVQGYLTRSSSPVLNLEVLLNDQRLQIHRQ
jgi:positive phototaxis protein PixI